MISLSIKEYIGVVYDGILLSLIFNINSQIFEIYYWFDDIHEELIIDEKLKELLNISDIKMYDKYDELITKINTDINRNEIYNNIMNDENNKLYFEMLYTYNTLTTLENLI